MTFGKQILLVAIVFALVGCGGAEQPTVRKTSMLSPFAGTYDVETKARDMATSRLHQRQFIEIKANGDVDFDSGIVLPAHLITTEYDHRSLCDFYAKENRAACRIQVQYDNKQSLEIFLDIDKQRVLKIRYKQHEQFSVSASVIYDDDDDSLLVDDADSLELSATAQPATGAPNNAAAEHNKDAEMPIYSLAHLQEYAAQHMDNHQTQARSFITLSDNNTVLWAGANGYSSDKRWLIGRVSADIKKPTTELNEEIILLSPPSNSVSSDSMATRLLADENSQFLYVLGIGNKHEYLVARLHLADLSVDLSFGSAGFAQLRNDTALIYGFAMDTQGGILLSGSNGRMEYHIYRFTKEGQPDFNFGNSGVLIETE